MSKSLISDDLNRAIVALLQEEGRITHAEMAERLEVSRPTIIDRIKRLEADGILEGYCARVSPNSVGKVTTAFVAVRHRFGDDDAMEASLLDALRKEPDVLECHTMAGEDCLLLKVVAESPMGLNTLLKRIRSMGDTLSTRTTVALQTHFVKPGPSPWPSETVKRPKK